MRGTRNDCKNDASALTNIFVVVFVFSSKGLEMRKGSTKKPVEINNDPDYTMPRFITTEYKPSGDVMNILLRICDACHEMDGHYEPWASIRMDIEKLR